MPKIYLIDVTNRDGVQTSRICLSKLQKTILNLYLNQLGVFQSEFGFPTTHHETNYLNANLELAEMNVLSPLRLGGWIRAIEEDVQETFKSCPKIKHLNLSMSTSEQMIRHKFKGKLDHASVIKEMTDAVRTARELGAESIGVNAEDASRTEIGYLIAFAHESGIHADGALKNRRNYELYDLEELGRGEPEAIETGRQITVGEYSGIKGFRNVYDKLEIEFKDEGDAARILELARYANVHNQRPLVEEELKFIAQYPDIACKLLTMSPLCKK